MSKNLIPKYSNEFQLLKPIKIAKVENNVNEIVTTKSISFNNEIIGKNSILREIDSVLRIPFLNASTEMKKLLLDDDVEKQISKKVSEKKEITFAHYDTFGSLIFPFCKWEKYCGLIRLLIDKQAILFDNISCENQDLLGDEEGQLCLDDMHCIIGYIVENFILQRMNT